MKLIIILFVYLMVIIRQNDGNIFLNVRLFNYKNPSDVLYDGRNCEKFYWAGDYCDPVFRICISAKQKCDLLNKKTNVFNNMKEIFTVFTESIPLIVWQKKISIEVKIDDEDSYDNIDHIAKFQGIFYLQAVGILSQKSLMVNPPSSRVRLQASISTKCSPGYYGALCDKGYNEYKCIKDCANGKCLWNERKKAYFCLCDKTWTGLKCNQLLTTKKPTFSTSQQTKDLKLNISKIKFLNFKKDLVKTTDISISKKSSKSSKPFKIIYISTTPSKQIHNSTKLYKKINTKHIFNFSTNISSLKPISTPININVFNQKTKTQKLDYATSSSATISTPININVFNQKTKIQKLDYATSSSATISTKPLSSKFTSAMESRFNFKLHKENYAKKFDKNLIFRKESVSPEIYRVNSFTKPSTSVNPNLSSSKIHQNLKSTQLLSSNFVISSTENSLNKHKVKTITFNKQGFAFNDIDEKYTSSISKNANSVTFNITHFSKFSTHIPYVNKFNFNTSDKHILSSKSSLKVSTTIFAFKKNQMSNKYKLFTTSSQPSVLTKGNDVHKKTTIQLISYKFNLSAFTSKIINQNSITKINKIYLETSNKSVNLTESNFNNASFTYLRMSVLKLLNQTFHNKYLIAICGAFWFCLIIMLIIIVIRKKQRINKFDTNKFIYRHQKAPTTNYHEPDLESEEVNIIQTTNPSIPFKSKILTQKPETEINNKNNDDSNEYETILRNLNNPNTESYVRLTYFSKTSEKPENNENFRPTNNTKDFSNC